jgi:hypothetical protein
MIGHGNFSTIQHGHDMAGLKEVWGMIEERSTDHERGTHQ